MLVKLYFAADGLFSIDLVKSYFFPNPIEVPEFLWEIGTPAYVLNGQLLKC